MLRPTLFLADAETHWLDRHVIDPFTGLFPANSFFSFSFNVHALLALLLVAFCCGAVGALIVGGRMAFFSDALAHCAFAGISIGFLLFEFVLRQRGGEFWRFATVVMVAFGALVGAGIAYVRGRTGLASDTVIGVFFAGSVGLAAALRKLIRNRNLFSLEDFLFGDPLLAGADDIVILAGLAVLTAALMFVLFNRLLLAGFNPSLALSRRVPVRLDSYVLVILLALIVNLCVRVVGVMLINALLIVTAASAVNLSVNLRQVFWLSIAICLGVAAGGQWLSWEVGVRAGVDVGIPGTVVLLACGVFVVSMLVGPWLRGRGGRAGERGVSTPR
jgi:zinc transport system permease protein